MNYLRHADLIWFESKSLAGNAMGNESLRLVTVLRPWGFDPACGYPSIWMLDGFAGNGFSIASSGARWGESFGDELLAMQRDGVFPPAFIVLPDASTRLGGSQFIDTPYAGAYATFLWDELLPYLEGRYPMLRSPRARLVTGHSSGGYGALLASMLRPGIFGSVIASASDSAFEWSLRPSLLPAAIALNKAGGVQAWLDARLGREPMSKWSKDDFLAFLTLAMASLYSPHMGSFPDERLEQDAEADFALPIRLDTLELRPAVWERWLQWDPIYLLDAHASELGELVHLHLDSGTEDEFAAQFGHRAIAAKLAALGIQCLHTEFKGTHRGTRYRYAERFSIWAQVASWG